MDTLASIDHDFYIGQKLKGVMTLVDTESQNKLLNFLKEHRLELRSGGSAANTMIALANSGVMVVILEKLQMTNMVSFTKGHGRRRNYF